MDRDASWRTPPSTKRVNSPPSAKRQNHLQNCILRSKISLIISCGGYHFILVTTISTWNLYSRYLKQRCSPPSVSSSGIGFVREARVKTFFKDCTVPPLLVHSVDDCSCLAHNDITMMPQKQTKNPNKILDLLTVAGKNEKYSPMVVKNGDLPWQNP